METHSQQTQGLFRRSRILDEVDLTSRSQPTKTHRRVRAYLDGCFDVMHTGHACLMREARLLCDELVVGVHSSAEIEKTKGCAPVQSDEERLKLVAAVKWVDEVVLSTCYSPNYLELLEKYDCDFCVHGSDVNLNADGKDPFEEVKRLGRFRAIERSQVISSSIIIDRLLKTTSEDINERKPSQAESEADSFLLSTDRLCQFMNTTRHRPHRPKEGQKVVYVAGSWDLFHSGHVRLLQEAKKLGDFLLVGIHEDTVVADHCGDGFPIMNLFERAMNVLGCRDVDEIIFDAPFVISEHMLQFLHIDVVVKPSLDIDYPNDSSNPYFYLEMRQHEQQSSIREKIKAAFTSSSSSTASTRSASEQSSSANSPTASSNATTTLISSSSSLKDRRVRVENALGSEDELNHPRPFEFAIVSLPVDRVLTSATLIKRIKSNRAKYEERNKKRETD